MFPLRLISFEELFHTGILLQAASSHAHKVPHTSWQDGVAPGFQLVDGCFYLIKQVFLAVRRNEICEGLFIQNLTQCVSQDISIPSVVVPACLSEPAAILDIADD